MRTALLVFVLVCSAAWAGPVVVGVKVAEPFVIEREDGTLGGLAIRLWEGVAEDLGVEYRYETRPDVASLLAGVGSGEFAVGVGAVTVTRDREELVDFTHPYYTGGLGIAVDADGGRPGFVRTMAAIWTPAFITGVTGLVVLLMGVGLVVWFVERRKNADQFGGGVLRGLGSGFWFSAVTMTTVGYGDKTPITPMGRVVALVWMFASIIVISFFTGAIASAFTASRLGGVVQGPEDLPRARVGVVDGTAGQDRLLERGVQARGFESVDAGLAAIADGSLDAFVHDEALVR
ncbi:MAG: transporter substrate-binding domain-containing protein, partial [Planctomycetota bacterium]